MDSLDLYNKLKLQLFQRLREKDPAVRVQAVKAISGLQTSEGLEDEEGRSVEDVLLEMMQYDPSRWVATTELRLKEYDKLNSCFTATSAA